MKIWIDAQLSPTIAKWIIETYSLEAIALRDLGLRDATDEEIFDVARKDDIAVMTKDRDFVDLVNRLGILPKVIWLTCGNTSNERLKEILRSTLLQAMEMLAQGESIVEIRDIQLTS